MPRLERIQIDRPGGPTSDEFNRLQTAIERALQTMARQVGISTTTGTGGGGGTLVAPASARYWLSTSNPSLPNGVDMGALGAGVIQQTVSSGIATPSALNVATGLIPFGATGAGLLTTTTTFWRDPADGTIVVGKTVNDWSPEAVAVFSRTSDGTVSVVSENLSTGTNVSADHVSYAGGTSVTRVGVLGPNTNTFMGALSTPGSGYLTHATATGSPLVLNVGGTGDLIVATTNLNVERMRVTSAGKVRVADLGTGGYVKASAGPGELSVVTTIPASDITGLFYQTIQNAGTPLTQRPAWNASTGLTAVDDAGNTRTDVTVNLSTGIAGGQSVIGGTGAGENLTYSSTTNGTKGLHIWGSTSTMFFDETNRVLSIGNASPGGTIGVQYNKSVNSGVLFGFSNPNTGGSAYVSFALGRDAAFAAGYTSALFSSGSGFSGQFGPTHVCHELYGGTGNFNFWLDQNSGDFVWYTTTAYPSTPERMRISNNGLLSVDGVALMTSGTALSVGTTSSHVDWPVNVSRNRNGGVYTTISNTSAGNSAEGGFVITQSPTSYGTTSVFFLLQGSGFGTIGPVTANSSLYEHVAAGATATMIFSAYGPQDIGFYTTTSRNLRLKIANGGDVSVANLSAGGIVKATAATGVLAIASSSDVAGAITWPAAKDILVSTGTTTAPNGSAAFNYDTNTDTFSLGDGAVQYWISGANTPSGNYAAALASWGTIFATSSFIIKAVKGGTGVVSPLVLNADTSALYLCATGATGNVNIAANAGSTPRINAGQTQVIFQPDVTKASAAGMTLDAFTFNTGSTIFSGSTAITTGTGVNFVAFNAPTYTTAANITAAATVAIYGPPTISGGGSITGSAYSLWVLAGKVSLDGDTIVNGNGANLGFFGSIGTTKQTSGANLTNNVTSGGTNDTIANFTDLTTYSNDSATIRNDIYQLARKLKQVNDALRAYGMLT